MPLNPWLAAVFAGLMLLIYGGGTLVAWWALFRDRARGRRRCPRCWHDLSHTPGLTCSECGHIAGAERQLARTRRRWALAAAAIGACVITSGWLYWRLADRGWTAYAPSRLLIVLLPVTGDGPVAREISARASRNALSAPQWSSLLQRSAHGDWWARPADERWRLKYEPMIGAAINRMQFGGEDGWEPDAIDALLDLPPGIDLATLPRWPHGSTPRLTITMEEWWPPSTEARLTLAPRAAGVEPVHLTRGSRARRWPPHSIPLEGLDPTIQRLPVEVIVEHRHGGGAWREVARRTHEFDLRFVDPTEMDLEAVDSPEWIHAIATTFRHGVARWVDGPSPVRFTFRPELTYVPEMVDAALGLRVELVHGGVVARRLDMWWLAGDMVDDRGTGWEVVHEDLAVLATLDESSAWTLRVTGDREIALRAGPAKRFWSGTVDIAAFPVREQEGTAPQRPWRREQAGQ